MTLEDRIRKDYAEYRISIGRPAINTSEDMQISVTFAHFKAGWMCRDKMTYKHVDVTGMLKKAQEEEDLTDAL